MPIATRMAQTTWEVQLPTGTGLIQTGSGAPGELPVTASELCPVSRLFAGAKITVDAKLEPAS